jgi:hypothetical protein
MAMSQVIAGNQVIEKSTVEFADGRVHETAEVLFDLFGLFSFPSHR